MKFLLLLLLAISSYATTLTGTLTSPHGGVATGTLTLSLNRAATSSCAGTLPPYQFTVTSGTITGPSIIATDCFSPAINYVAYFTDSNGLVFTGNWGVKGNTFDVGQAVLGVPGNIQGMPAGDQYINQPPGSKLYYNGAELNNSHSIAAASSIISGTTAANMTASIVGIGTLFLTEVHVGDRIALSSDLGNIGTISKVTDDTHLELDFGYWGDSLGDGTSQTITVFPAAQTIANNSGDVFVIFGGDGHMCVQCTNPLWSSGSGTVGVPNPTDLIMFNHVFTGSEAIGIDMFLGATSGSQLEVEFASITTTGTGSVAGIDAITGDVILNGNTTLSNHINAIRGLVTVNTPFASSSTPLIALFGGVQTEDAGITVPLASAVWGWIGNYKGTITQADNFHGEVPDHTSSFSLPWLNGFFQEAIGGSADEAFPIWLDEQGAYVVHSINTFDSVYQARPALYNPLFTKFTSGAVNQERCIPGCQWETNVAFIGTEASGTGTLRSVQVDGSTVVLGSGTHHVLVNDLKNTGSATGKKTVCVDTTTGQLYASSTGTDCSN